MTQRAFFVNSDACSGCKTCQVACKDKNNLPAGLHWRKVYEIAAGGWERKGDAWVSTVAAYHLSVACHHCLDPACMAACSPQAIWKRAEDGIVLIDESRCTRCNSCPPACPYGAIRRGPGSTFSKCDFCVDEIDGKMPPACVAACPNRALDYGDLEELRKKHGRLGRVFPLPDAAAARPALVIKPHRNLARMEKLNPEIMNSEEL